LMPLLCSASIDAVADIAGCRSSPAVGAAPGLDRANLSTPLVNLSAPPPPARASTTVNSIQLIRKLLSLICGLPPLGFDPSADTEIRLG
jgi:hypothetical protein